MTVLSARAGELPDLVLPIKLALGHPNHLPYSLPGHEAELNYPLMLGVAGKDLRQAVPQGANFIIGQNTFPWLRPWWPPHPLNGIVIEVATRHSPTQHCAKVLKAFHCLAGSIALGDRINHARSVTAMEFA